MAAQTYHGTKTRADAGSPFNAINALVRSVLSSIDTACVVQVQSVNTTGIEPVGFVDVVPMVHQQDGKGSVVPHGTVYNLPYFRLQGGASAVICDPVAGDIGIAIIANRDITKVAATRAPAAPDTFRQFDLADGLYVGGVLNAAPTEYIWLTGHGITVQTAGVFKVTASQATFDCPVVTDNNVTVGTGATGTFSTPTGQTVTVRDGIVTNIY